jgi:hypothetical protein
LYKISKETNIDNVLVNRILSPVIILLYLYIYKFYLDIEKPIHHAFISLFVYYFCSRFFQPDLDNTPHRPGKYSFPLSIDFITNLSKVVKFTLKLIGIRINRGKMIEGVLLIIRPISLVWYILWEPYALLFTHRGLSHFPIIGTYTRIIYLSLILKLIDFGLDLDVSALLSHAYLWPEGFSFLGNSYSFDLKIWIIWFSPIFLGDIIHSLFDLIEAKGKGNSFVPSKAEPGYISKFLKLFHLKIRV